MICSIIRTDFGISRESERRYTKMISIHSIFVGRPQRITDETGVWESSIFRKAVFGPVELGSRGIVGDQVADSVHHGRPSQAVCVHPIEGRAPARSGVARKTKATPPN